MGELVLLDEEDVENPLLVVSRNVPELKVDDLLLVVLRTVLELKLK